MPGREDMIVRERGEQQVASFRRRRYTCPENPETFNDIKMGYITMVRRPGTGLSRRTSLAGLALGGANLLIRSGRAADKMYGPGVTDTEIKIGSTVSYSGPTSAFGAIGKAAAAFYKMTNDQGGVNGRTINCDSLDNGGSPPKSVEVVRSLVEQ